MAVDRRSFVSGVAALASLSALPARAQAEAFEPALTRAQALLEGFHGDLGQTRSEPAPLRTGRPDVNEGLRFDETGVFEAQDAFVFQTCARADDAAEKARPGVLPIFELFATRYDPSVSLAGKFARMADVLGHLGLDPARLGFVSIPEFSDVAPHLADLGLVRADNVALRDRAAAVQSGAGSGYFRAPGETDGFATVGLYYALSDNPGALRDGTAAGWIEIGEAAIAEHDELSYAFGVERLAMAMSGDVPPWNSRLSLLSDKLAHEGQ